MKAVYYVPLSVSISNYSLRKHHVIFPIGYTPTHTEIAHLDTINGLFKTRRAITHAQFKTQYRRLRESEVHLLE